MIDAHKIGRWDWQCLCPAMSGAEPCTGSKRLGNVRSGLMLALGSDADGAGAGGAEIGEDVAEQVAGDDDVETVGVHDEVRREDVDVVFVNCDVGEVGGHCLRRAGPSRAWKWRCVALGGRGQVLLGTALGQVEGVLQDPVHTGAGHHCFLDARFRGRCLRRSFRRCWSIRLQYFRGRRRSRRRRERGQPTGRCTPGSELDGAQADVLVKAPAELQQAAPERNVVGNNLGPTDGTEKDRVE